mgnify:CR=1 FL=1
MGQRKYPPLSTDQVIRILIALGFVEIKKRGKGDHRFFILERNGQTYIPQVDNGCPEYSDDILKLLIDETGFTRKQFYGATRSSAKKINLRYIPER